MKDLFTLVLISKDLDKVDACNQVLDQSAEADYCIAVATDIGQAIPMIEMHLPDGVLIDEAMLTDDRGRRALANLQTEASGTPLILLAGAAGEHTADTDNALSAIKHHISFSDIGNNGLHNIIQQAMAKVITQDIPAPRKPGLTLLLIDDNLGDRARYAHTLHKSEIMEYTLFECDHYEEGLEIIESYQPHCVLLSQSLDGRNSVEALKNIRSKYPDLAIVVLTNHGSETTAVQVMKEGAQDYITKSSISKHSIDRIIKLAIERSAEQRNISEQKELLSSFTHALANDVAGSLVTILSFAKLLRRQAIGNNAVYESGDHITNAAKRIEGLIENIYTYSRIAAMPSNIRKENCDCTKIIREVMSDLQDKMLETNAAVTYDPLPIVFTNHVQLSLVFKYLIHNALHYNNKNHALVHISFTRNQDTGVFSLEDNGPGIKNDHHEKIFEPFTRFNTDKNGSGLGLTICRKVIESQGGSIWYETNRKGGATFHFSLPGHAIAGQINEPLGPHTTSTGTPSLAKVLLVEDNKLDIELARMVMFEVHKLQFELFTVGNGDEALKFLNDRRQPNIDLVLLDINMPVMNGFEFLEQIRSQKGLDCPPVIMYSTSNYEANRTRATSLGAAGYIVKPINLDKLRNALRNVKNVELIANGDGYAIKKTTLHSHRSAPPA